MIEHPLEADYWLEYDRILGMDEAGRGPIAGPLYVAGVIFEKGYENPNLYDSKKLSAKKRRALVETIMNDALWYQIRVIEEEQIDSLNIYRAAQKAMEDIAACAKADLVLSDAMPLTNGLLHEAVVKGDTKSISIAAASILAKTFRDLYMLGLDSLYPQYGFKNHKGYPTKAHLEAIKRYGVNEHFRKSYSPVKKILLESCVQSLF